MIAVDELAARIAALGSVEFEGEAFRPVSPGVDPHSGAGARMHAGGGTRLGLEAILAPSATGVGAVLVASPDRLDPDSRVQSVRSEAWIAPP